MRRAFIYPHRSVRVLPVTAGRAAGAVAAGIALTTLVWMFSTTLIGAHNALALQLCRLAGLPEARAASAIAYGYPLEVVVVAQGDVSRWVPPIAIVLTVFAVALVMRRQPLARGLGGFVLAILGLSVIAWMLGTPAMTAVESYATIWLQTELLVWLMLPALTTALFAVLQPSLLRGLAWMIGIEAFAVAWSAIRLVVVLGIGHFTGTMLLPTAWFVFGLLADVLYIVTFYAWSIHLSLGLSQERR